MKFKTVVLWWIVNQKKHKYLNESDQKICALEPLVKELFPGITYCSVTGFSSAMLECVVPAIKKLFPELLTTPAEAIEPEATTEINKVLPSDRYEWQDSSQWRDAFEKFLTTA